MTMYLLLLIATAVAAGLAVWLYRSISSWHVSDVKMVSFSGGSGQFQTKLQQGYIGGQRRADGSVVWNVRKNSKLAPKSSQATKRTRKSANREKDIRKPWGW